MSTTVTPAGWAEVQERAWRGLEPLPGPPSTEPTPAGFAANYRYPWVDMLAGPLPSEKPTTECILHLRAPLREPVQWRPDLTRKESLRWADNSMSGFAYEGDYDKCVEILEAHRVPVGELGAVSMALLEVTDRPCDGDKATSE